MHLSSLRRARSAVVLPAAGVAVRRALARRRWLRWAVVAALAAAAGGSFLAASERAEVERAAWGTVVEVVVADGVHRPGDPMRTRTVSVPAAVVPVGAVVAVDAAAVARQDLGPGEIVVRADLAPGTGRFALAPSGTVVVAVSDPLVADAPLGVRVVIASEGVVVSDHGLVVAVESGVLHVAVPEDEAAMVAAAASLLTASVLVPSELDQVP